MSKKELKLSFCNSLFKYERFKTRMVKVGNIAIGAKHPIRLQSMTTTDTLDINTTVDQCIKIFEAGGELVRITTQGRREANALKNIKEELLAKSYNFPLVADIHFNPNAAEIAAKTVEKVRINPGNFVGAAKKFQYDNISEEDFQAGLSLIKNKLLPFLDICKANNTTLRIGANHGSLSDRIMAKYGDTPLGMVESIMEYLRICREENFHDIILSIKSSNTRVMVHTVRLLVATMKKEGMDYPLHLGVTEAGSGEDGRIKSAVGIGALLADGLGDTIRVSLTESPEAEIPVARIIKTHFEKRISSKSVKRVDSSGYSPYEFTKRISHDVGIIGGNNQAAVIPDLRNGYLSDVLSTIPEAVIVNSPNEPLPEGLSNIIRIIPFSALNEEANNEKVWPLVKAHEIELIKENKIKVLEVSLSELNQELISYLEIHPLTIILLSTKHKNSHAELRAFFMKLQYHELTHPVIIHQSYDIDDLETLQIISACDTGLLFLDGYGDGLSLNTKQLSVEDNTKLHFGILQAARIRFTKTEFISCPGCGRTLFDLQKTTEHVKQRTSHLKGLKIAIMGCIVNGIGEMADADYGYVGAGPGKVSLFKNRELKKKDVPENIAVEELIKLIKQNGDWIHP